MTGKRNNTEKKIIFLDHYPNFDKSDNEIVNTLKKHEIKFCIDDDPQYIIHFPYFRNEYLRYDGIRIFWTGENVTPDFNVVDYAIGFDYLDFGDRYFRYPVYLSYKDDLERAINKANDCIPIKERKFCNFVYSNAEADSSREEFFELLCKYKMVDSGGKYRNNIGKKPVDDKLEFQKRYKFSIAFENSSYPGYTTEKILQAFAANTVPIYWGNPLIAKEFNPNAFINCHEYGSFDEVVEEIKRIDQDDDLFQKYLSEPAFTEEQIKQVNQTYDELESFLIRIFIQPFDKAFRRPMGYWGKLYEKEQKMLFLNMTDDTISFFSLKYVLNTIVHKVLRRVKNSIYSLFHNENS